MAAGACKAILSIDGGGIRGIIPALVLAHIEEQTGMATAQLFDVIAGTSTGGILALGLTCPDGDRPRFSARELAELYEREGARIFPHEFLGVVRRLFGPRYPSRGREKVLARELGDTRLKDALAEVIVTGYDIQARRPVFFRKALAASEPATRDFAMRDVALATSAAPTYFEPVRLRTADGGAELVIVDGGVFANNPAMCAFVDRTTVEGDRDSALVVSLGTGSLTHPFTYAQARRWGLIGWGPHILDVVFDGVSESVEYELETILGHEYHRFQVELVGVSDRMDDVSRPNVARLRRKAEELIAGRRDELDALAERLVQRRSPVPPAAAT
jgi:patatin-like phospholipase/acyl hydrolase